MGADNGDNSTDNGNKGTDNGNNGTDNGNELTDNGDEGTGTRNGARHTIESGMIPCDDAKISRPANEQTNKHKQTNKRMRDSTRNAAKAKQSPGAKERLKCRNDINAKEAQWHQCRHGARRVDRSQTA
jgi:hypothetical protein